MFLAAERMASVQDILFNNTPQPESYQNLQRFQEQDFLELFELLGAKEIVIRYLDAPLHEFGGEAEANPMLGFRGARMLIAKPELIKIQTRAIYSALAKVAVKPRLVLEIPLVVSTIEVQLFKKVVSETLQEFQKIAEPKFAVMLETPRACLLAGEISKEVDYLSFGTNDLTQMTYGFSRDDSAVFLEVYKKQGVLEQNPFEELDEFGVAKLMEGAITSAKQANPKVHISVCGEQAGTSHTLKILKKLGVASISVSAGKVWPSIYRLASML
jgi:pyruvate,orthophosphate dikinase